MAGEDAAPRLSVVIPVRNRPLDVCRAISSVLTAEVDDLGAVEVVVVDDGSDDATPDAVRGFGDPRVRLVQQAPQGVAVARNRGVDEAHALFVAFLDSDDLALPGWTAAMLGAAQRGLDLFSCASVNHRDGSAATVEAPASLGGLFGGLRGRYLAGCFGVSRSAFLRAGGYLPGLLHGENTGLWIGLGRAHLAQELRVDAVDEPLVQIHYRDRPYDAERYYSGSRMMFDAYGDMLNRDRRARSLYLGVYGLAASRLGKRREAIGLLARSAALRPHSFTAWLRLARAVVRSSSR